MWSGETDELRRAEMENDVVNHPSHYTTGTLEVIDAIEGMGLPYHEGNIVKYVARWRHKAGVVDLKKAAWYLKRLIDKAEAEQVAKLVTPQAGQIRPLHSLCDHGPEAFCPHCAPEKFAAA
jgi:hypothetical protein